MYQTRVQIRLLEGGAEAADAVIYEAEWPSIPSIGEQVLIGEGTAAEALLQVEMVRHVIGLDGRWTRIDVDVRRVG